ncbi:Leucine-rich repeat-containing protein 34 [Sciurus carolinensis]|uniref:Leucine-rich repeat-containing protein 34 n=1 Tax=Sciurus carolinensis TaxID=30640 RepID=A0AA41MDJ4_SCICA|nr:Leucine-rich repeat-containing protein 34 [Sciurus carolinensis]
MAAQQSSQPLAERMMGSCLLEKVAQETETIDTPTPAPTPDPNRESASESESGLDVRYNVLSDVGAYYAAKLLQTQRYLIYLNLMFNDIGPEGGELIAKALHKNTTLKYLRMTGNKIENKGGMFFASMLQINSSLEKLDLGDCDLGMQTVIAFATVLTQNQAVKGINLNRPLLYGEQAYSDLIQMGRLKPDNTDVEPYVVDGHVYLAEVSNGLKKHYYWTPTHRDANSPSSSAGFALVSVGQYF